MNILMCGDADKGFFGMEACIYSVMKHNKNVHFYIFMMDYNRADGQVFRSLFDWQQDKLTKIVRYFDPKHSSIHFIDTYKYYEEYFLHGVDENDGHSSPYAPLRLIIDIVLPSIKDILYLDCDVIVQGDLHTMYNDYLAKIRQSEYAYAAHTIHLNSGKGEMVAGILLFDMIKAKQSGLFKQARINITTNKYRWYDQSALEDASKYVELPETYNYMYKYENRSYEPIILHFCNELSPKIYENGSDTADVFYKKYPHLEYIREGCKLIDTINGL